jgi:hypothetical protein
MNGSSTEKMFNVTLTPQWKDFLRHIKRGQLKTMVLPHEGVNHVILRMDDFQDLCVKANVTPFLPQAPSNIVPGDVNG